MNVKIRKRERKDRDTIQYTDLKVDNIHLVIGLPRKGMTFFLYNWMLLSQKDYLRTLLTVRR